MKEKLQIFNYMSRWLLLLLLVTTVAIISLVLTLTQPDFRVSQVKRLVTRQQLPTSRSLWPLPTNIQPSVIITPAVTPTVTPTTTQSQQPTSTSPIVIGDKLVISEKDSGKSFLVKESAQVILRLTNQYLWSYPKVVGSSVQLVPVNYFQNPGFGEWNLELIAKGESRITSTGTANCPRGQACPQDELPFSVIVSVL